MPYLNTAPILAGQSFTFEFPVIQSGTYWYHSHTDLQIQRGVYGSLVFREQELSDQGHAAHNTGHGDGHGIASDESFSILELANMLTDNVVMTPAKPGNRQSTEIVTAKTRALGWQPLKSLREYLAN